MATIRGYIYILQDIHTGVIMRMTTSELQAELEYYQNSDKYRLIRYFNEHPQCRFDDKYVPRLERNF